MEGFYTSHPESDPMSPYNKGDLKEGVEGFFSRLDYDYITVPRFRHLRLKRVETSFDFYSADQVLDRDFLLILRPHVPQDDLALIKLLLA